MGTYSGFEEILEDMEGLQYLRNYLVSLINFSYQVNSNLQSAIDLLELTSLRSVLENVTAEEIVEE
jgi:hypothetical protein